MFAKCQTTLSSAALCNFFLARPEKVCYSFFLSSLLSLVFPLFFCNNLRPVTHRPCACAWVCACVWADWNVLRLHLHLRLRLCLLPSRLEHTRTRMCWQHLCNGKFVRIVRVAGELLLPPCLSVSLPSYVCDPTKLGSCCQPLGVPYKIAANLPKQFANLLQIRVNTDMTQSTPTAACEIDKDRQQQKDSVCVRGRGTAQLTCRGLQRRRESRKKRNWLAAWQPQLVGSLY